MKRFMKENRKLKEENKKQKEFIEEQVRFMNKASADAVEELHEKCEGQEQQIALLKHIISQELTILAGNQPEGFATEAMRRACEEL